MTGFVAANVTAHAWDVRGEGHPHWCVVCGPQSPAAPRAVRLSVRGLTLQARDTTRHAHGRFVVSDDLLALLIRLDMAAGEKAGSRLAVYTGQNTNTLGAVFQLSCFRISRAVPSAV